jgi:hypothetical protein
MNGLEPFSCTSIIAFDIVSIFGTQTNNALPRMFGVILIIYFFVLKVSPMTTSFVYLTELNEIIGINYSNQSIELNVSTSIKEISTAWICDQVRLIENLPGSRKNSQLSRIHFIRKVSLIVGRVQSKLSRYLLYKPNLFCSMIFIYFLVHGHYLTVFRQLFFSNTSSNNRFVYLLSMHYLL